MNTLSLVIQREYLTRVRKRSFIIMTLLMPLLMVALSFVPLWLSTLNDGAVKNIAVIDNTGIYAPLLKSTDLYRFQIINEAQQGEYQSKIGKDLFAILQITEDLSRNSQAVTILSEKQTPQELRTMVESALNEKVMEQRLDDLSRQGNVNAEAISEVRSIIEAGSDISVKTMKWGDDSVGIIHRDCHHYRNGIYHSYLHVYPDVRKHGDAGCSGREEKSCGGGDGFVGKACQPVGRKNYRDRFGGDYPAHYLGSADRGVVYLALPVYCFTTTSPGGCAGRDEQLRHGGNHESRIECQLV